MATGRGGYGSTRSGSALYITRVACVRASGLFVCRWFCRTLLALDASTDRLEDRQAGLRVAHLIIDQQGRLGAKLAARVEHDLAHILGEGQVGIEPAKIRRHAADQRR